LNARMLEAAKHPQVSLWTNTIIEQLDGKAPHLQVRLNQLPRYVDMDRCTACGDCVTACPVTVPGTERKAIYLSGEGQPECAAIAKEGQAPCSHACPGGIHVQGYIALIAQGRFQEAIDLIREAIPFPAICGRICTHPCEVDCSRTEVDDPVSIRLLKRFVSDWELENGEPRKAGRNGGTPSALPGRVAIVGAGPGGMTAAGQLAQMGHQVTVFEKLPVMGGMMAVGIPEYRLPRDVSAR
jgi:NADPH-dependent glutamate synthase beta subunit-like oxidoreductase/NAD-dependent dihydropyrimidine dehydrogenase PreA subunit